jgi:protein associated with RNAse G/E
MKAGEKIRVEVYKADGERYRYWDTIVEECSDSHIVTVSPAGESTVDLKRGTWIGKHILRAYYWFDRLYNLIEIFEPDGRLLEIYINIASLPWIKDGVLCFTDHELDVSAYPPAQAVVADEDEFAEAAARYGYTQEFQREMYQLVDDALELANHWQAKAAPTFGTENVE